MLKEVDDVLKMERLPKMELLPVLMTEHMLKMERHTLLKTELMLEMELIPRCEDIISPWVLQRLRRPRY